MAVAKEQIRQIISENNITSVADVLLIVSKFFRKYNSSRGECDSIAENLTSLEYKNQAG